MNFVSQEYHTIAVPLIQDTALFFFLFWYAIIPKNRQRGGGAHGVPQCVQLYVQLLFCTVCEIPLLFFLGIS